MSFFYIYTYWHLTDHSVVPRICWYQVNLVQYFKVFSERGSNFHCKKTVFLDNRVFLFKKKNLFFLDKHALRRFDPKYNSFQFASLTKSPSGKLCYTELQRGMNGWGLENKWNFYFKVEFLFLDFRITLNFSLTLLILTWSHGNKIYSIYMHYIWINLKITISTFLKKEILTKFTMLYRKLELTTYEGIIELMTTHVAPHTRNCWGHRLKFLFFFFNPHNQVFLIW